MNHEDRATVLVVDDMPDNILLLESILFGTYNVCAATNGEKALQIVRSDSPPDIVLLDVMMPGIDGYEVCRQIKGDDQTAFIPVVMVTALSGRDDRMRALDAGADDFLTKPIDQTEVKTRVRSLLRVKKLHDALQRSFEDLQRLENLRENLTHMIVHDMRTPLSAIIGGLDLLYDYAAVEGNPDAEEMHEMSLTNSHKLLRMINDLLDITRMESGEMQLDQSAVHAGEITTEVESTVQALAKLKTITITVDAAPGLPLMWADREVLRRVLINLLGNALKFTPAGGEVSLRVEPGMEGFIKFAVIDTGPGIPEGFEEKIFEKFGQVDKAGAEKTLSTGLGLTFCKMAVEAHDGKIWVERMPERGSNFSVIWPVASAG